MKSPFDNGAEWLEVEAVDSTQRLAAEALREGRPVGAVFAHEQRSGVGRFGRAWHSDRGDSLTVSFLFRAYADWPKPHLVGMAVAIAAAGALRSRLQWPNDLVIGSRKVAGVLTELLPDEAGHMVPVVGLGVNLNQREFPPEIALRATSLALAHGGEYDAREVARSVLERLADLPEPNDWSDLAPIWSVFDATPGKRYRLPSGEEAAALGIGPDGRLLCAVEGESRVALAAEALFGTTA